MKKFLTGIFVVFFSVPAFAVKVTGTVYDDLGVPLYAASIQQVDNLANGTITNEQGEFSIDVPNDDTQLTIKYIGMKTQSLTATQANGKNIILAVDTALLDEGTTIGCVTKSIANAKNVLYDSSTGKCVPTACESERYELTNNRTVQYRTSNNTVASTPDADCDNCSTITIGDACVDRAGTPCTSTDKNAKIAKYEWDDTNKRLNCVVKKCNDHFMLPNGTCVPSDGPCSAEQIAAIPHATAGELKRGVCNATECDGGGYEVSGGKCVEISGGCKPMPANAKVAHRVWNTETNSEQCIIDECAADYNVSDNKLSCIEKPQPTLTAEQSAAKTQELRENYNTQKAKEQSTANKLIGAAGIGATGIGAQMAASALAEQRADNVAEADMTAYLATFKCDYGMGRNINGGDKEVELPGGNDLLPLYNEYKTLADDLRTRKETLGLSAGIESQVILDKASTGLYDDESTGITNGTYASLARALANPTGADAEKWNAQKSETSQKLKAGAITAGVGAAASLVANVAVNSGGAQQNRSDEIVAKYAPLYKLQNDVAKLPDSEASITCPPDTTGTYPNCECKNKNKMVFNTNSNMCEACPSDRTVQDGKCVVAAPNAKCDTSDPNIVVAADGTCSCQNGFLPSADGQTCECPTTGFAIEDGQCVRNNPTLATLPQITQQSTGLLAQVATDIMPAQHIILPAKNLFALGKSTLTPAAKNTITSFASQVKTSVAMGDSPDYCITVVGHTDKTGNAQLNNNLSVNRANAVKEALISAGLSVQNIQASGRGQTECTMNGAQESCRKVDITYRDSKC